ncbi:MAG: hypothetical protein KME33_35830 [Aetokthonos hydrillicola CCALA 1050]|nr:hypothetical protein [Aetokthonos hydrillicola CCALA 1050]MBW4590500.1 hypothetical protein [Aetokthonos hydrillicola CCALA 1050]
MSQVATDDDLSLEEQKDRLHLERIIEKSFYEAGKALKELRDRRLYRNSYATFQEYCRERFSFTHRHVNYLISGSIIVDNILTGTIGSQIVPTSERQVRPLTKLEPDKQRIVWQMAVEEAGNKVPSSTVVKDIVEREIKRTKVPISNSVGEVCLIIPKDNPDLKGKNGCWCIITYIGDCSCTVTTWDNEFVVKPDNIKSFDYLEEECTFMQQLCWRLKKLYQVGNLDSAAYWVLNGLAKLSTPYLTQLQEKMLSFLEQEYGTD